jgi:hypothetical protein
MDGWLGNAKNQAILVALLTWLQHRFSQALRDDFPSLKIDVIKVEYIGTYPALGVRGDYPDDMPERLNDLTEHILSHSSVNDFLHFVLDDSVDWTAEAQTLLSR